MKLQARSLFVPVQGNFISHVLEEDRLTIMSYDKDILKDEIEKLSSLIDSLSISELSLDEPDLVSLLRRRRDDIFNEFTDVYWSLDTPGKVRSVSQIS